MAAEDPDGPSPLFSEEAYHRLLEETRAVADKALGRLRGLGSRLPVGVLGQVERLHEDPARERRKAVRVSDSAIPVAVRAENLPAAEGTALNDHSPTGLAVRLPCPAGVGAVLRVRMPPEVGGGGWVAVEVRYCRRAAEGWVAGCELLAEQPPI